MMARVPKIPIPTPHCAHTETCCAGAMPEVIQAAAMPDAELLGEGLLAGCSGSNALAASAAAQRVAELSLQLLQAVADFKEAHLGQHRPLLVAALGMFAPLDAADPQASHIDDAQVHPSHARAQAGSAAPSSPALSLFSAAILDLNAIHSATTYYTRPWRGAKVSCESKHRYMLQVSEELQACSKSVAQLFEKGQDFDQDRLGITVLHSLLQVAHRLKDDSLSETLEDMGSMLPPTSIAPEHTLLGLECTDSCSGPGSLQQQTVMPLAFWTS